MARNLLLLFVLLTCFITTSFSVEIKNNYLINENKQFKERAGYKPKLTELFSKIYNTALDSKGQPANLTLYDRISSLVQIEGPNQEKIIICGLGARDFDAKSFPYSNNYLVENCIIRSEDGGKTWKAITPEGKTDRKVYGMSANDKGVVVAVCGDRGESCIMSSVDYGKTFKVRLSKNDFNSKSALYNSYYSKSRGIFLVPTASGTFTSSDGINWSKGIYTMIMGRNGYTIDELDEIWVAGKTLSVLKKGQKNQTTVLKDRDGRTFSSFNYLGNGVMISIAYVLKAVKYNTKTVTKIKRVNNILYLTIPNHKLEEGYLAMNVKSNTPYYSPIQSSLKYTILDENVIKMKQIGKELSEQSCNFNVRVISDSLAPSVRIYRSVDYGKTWTDYLLKGLVWFETGFLWSREFTNVGNGIVYLNNPGWENNPENECAAILKSVDYGATWELTDEIVATNNEKINAIYRSFKNPDGTILLGCQNHCRLIKLE